MVLIIGLSDFKVLPMTDRIKITTSRSRRLRKTMVMVCRWEKNSEREAMAAAAAEVSVQSYETL